MLVLTNAHTGIIRSFKRKVLKKRRAYSIGEAKMIKESYGLIASYAFMVYGITILCRFIFTFGMYRGLGNYACALLLSYLVMVFTYKFSVVKTYTF